MDAGGVGESIRDGVTGRLVRGGESFAQVVREVVSITTGKPQLLVLDGFDLGVGMLLKGFSRDEKERRTLVFGKDQVPDGGGVAASGAAAPSAGAGIAPRDTAAAASASPMPNCASMPWPMALP